MDNTQILALRRNHDIFSANLMLILHFLKNRTDFENYNNWLDTFSKLNYENLLAILKMNFDVDEIEGLIDSRPTEELKMLVLEKTTKKLNDSHTALSATCEHFMKSIFTGHFDMAKVSGIVKKIYSILNTPENMTLLKNRDPKLFQLKTKNPTGKLVTMTIIPGIDLIYGWYLLTEQDKLELWTYLNNLYMTSLRLVHIANGTEGELSKTEFRELNYKELKKKFVEYFPSQTVINLTNLDIDPFAGIGVQTTGFGVNEMVKNAVSGVEKYDDKPGISSIAKMMGADKLLNMEELRKQLQNINPKELKEASNNIKKLMGSNLDNNSADFIGDILEDITCELKSDKLSGGDAIENIVRVAEAVAQRVMPKMEKKEIDVTKIWQSTGNLAAGIDKMAGGTGSGIGNPINMLTALMQGTLQKSADGKEMSPEEQKKILEESQAMMSKLGMNMDFGKMFGTMGNKSDKLEKSDKKSEKKSDKKKGK